MQFMNLQEIIRGKISHFVNQNQLYPYMMMGAVGCWSLNAWMGPSPILRALQAGLAGNWDEQKEICMAMVKAMAGGNREDAYSSKLAINEAGYCYAGPPRPPYRILKGDAQTRAKEVAKRWRALCERYPGKTSAAA